MSNLSEYREQRRADQIAAAEQARADKAAAAEQARAQLELQARLETERITATAAERLRALELRQAADAQARAAEEQRRAEARAARGRWWAARIEWLRRDGLITVVLLVSALLSWWGMAVFGSVVYGGIGVVLPVFSEGLFVALSIRYRQARTHGPAPWLLLGLVLAGVTTAGMQVVHGLAGDEGAWWRAAIMATVSVSGVIAHQLVHAAPRRTPEQRAEARVTRIAARRVARMREAAVRQAVAELADDGTVTLVHQPGLVTLRGNKLVEAIPTSNTSATGDAGGEWDEVDLAYQELLRGDLPLSEDLIERLDTAVTGVTAPGQTPDDTQTAGGVDTSDRPAGNDVDAWVALAETRIAQGQLRLTDPQRTYREVLGCQMRMAGRVQRRLRTRAGLPNTGNAGNTRRRRDRDA
jgi:hypothetical protein